MEALKLGNSLFVGIAVWLLSASAYAQTDTIASKVHELEGVTVTETRRGHTLSSTSPLHLLDRHDMLTMGVVDMADALHRLPGITLRDYGGAGGMKTVSVRGFGAKHTGVSYDGVMLSECQSGEIDLSRYSLDNVDHLTLTIGDNDDIFIPARNATTPATLSINTMPVVNAQRSTFNVQHSTFNVQRPTSNAQLKTGSFGLISPFLRYEQSLSEHFAFSAVGEYTYAENDYPYTIKNVTETVSDRRTNSRMNSGHAELNFVYDVNQKNRMCGKVYYYDNDRQLPGQVRYYTNLSGETLRDRNAFGQLMYQTRWDDKLSLKVQGKMNWAASIYRDALSPNGFNDADYWQREWYGSMALLFTPHERWALDYSADYAYNNLNGSSGRTVISRPYRQTILQSATAKYHVSRLTVMGRLLHSLYLNDAKEGTHARDMRKLSPSLSLSYLLLKGVRVRASYKNIFRSPTFNESYYFHYGSPDLLPESTDQWNLGVTYVAKASQHTEMTVTADGYVNHVKDMIVSVPLNMFVWTCINVGKVRVLGLDATLRATQYFTGRQRLTMTSNYSYQSVRNRTNPESPYYNNQIAYMPEHSAAASLGYENPWLNVSFYGMGISSRWTNNEHLEGTLVDGYTEFGLTVWKKIHIGRHLLEGRADVRNLFDKQYEIVAFYPMPGRSYQLTVNIKY